MTSRRSPEKRIYDLYSFDAPYDLEPVGSSGLLRDYAKGFDLKRELTAVDTEDEASHVDGLDLSFEDAEVVHGFPAPPLSPALGEGRPAGLRSAPSHVLGATLSQRKTLLKERIDELLADIRRRERLEQRLLERADEEGAGLELLLGWVRDFSPGNYPSVDARRTNLERDILALKKASWDEQLRCWRDLVMLKKELRQVLEEYHLVLSAEGISGEG